MFAKNHSFYAFWFSFIHLINVTHLTFHDSGHGFMAKKSRYFDDELSQLQEEIESLRHFQSVDSQANLNLRFDPEFLDFSDRSLGTPHSHTVTLYNTDSNRSVDLTSISGNTVHFHSSFFEDKQIPPNGNTSFKVVYLGRQEGPVESTLFLHTSNGFVKYNVKAFGTFNNYRVRPIVGVKLPVNATFTPIIYMHNPYSEPIQIVEIYSSGGGFHLELPSGQHEGPNDLWEIDPHETKAVIRVRFEAKVPHNYTAYIRIKLHHPDEILIIPLEVEVTQVQNIFHPQGYVDFGMGGSMDDPKEVNLCLYNPLKRAVRVHSVSTLSKSIKIHYYNVRINPASDDANKPNMCVNVGTLTLDWKNAWQNQDYYGKIIVKFRNGKNRTEIPYFLTVLKGGLSYDKMSTAYFLNDKEMDTKERRFEILNEFFHPVKIVDVKFPLDMDTTFKVKTFTPLTVRPFEKKNLFNILLKSSAKKTDMQLTSHIKVLSNISEIHVPLLSYNGKLQIHLPFPSDDRTLNVGLIGHHKKMQFVFTLTNSNPVELPLLELTTSLPMSELEICGCGVGDHGHIIMHNSFENLTKCDKIDAQGFAVVRMTINTGDVDGHMKGHVHIQTPYENLSLPVYYKVAAGEMIIDRDDLLFSNCFPAKMCTHPLRVFSSFSERMSVENILTLPPDRRVSAAITGSILPKIKRVIGHMYFNPDLDCSPECYTGFVTEGSASWLRTLVISKQVSEYDLKLVNTFYGRYLNFTQNGSKALRNISLRLDTTEVKGQMFVSKIVYTWPTVVRQSNIVNSTLQFPLTQVRNSSHKVLVLHNPANHSLVVQLLFENDYPHAEMLYDGLPGGFIPPSNVKYTSANWFAFDKRMMESQQKFFSENLGLFVHKQSLPFILLPGQSKRVSLEFTAEEARPYSNLLLIRNNLTILEIVRLNGKGTIPRFEFAALRPGDLKPLQFELTEKRMRSCNADLNQKPSLPEPDLTVKQSFLAKNLGEIPVHVTSFSINGYLCEGYGFKVINCEPFTLAPNSSRKIDLAFTPDLTLQEVSRVLIIGTSLNSFVNYSLKATISRNYCRHCGLLLPRPKFESFMYYTMTAIVISTLMIVFCAAYADTCDFKTKAAAACKASTSSATMLPVLDLRKIGRQVREEIQSSMKQKAKLESTPPPKEEDTIKTEPAVIPTTGKAKRKLCQKNSLTDRENSVEDDAEKERVRERLRKKDILFERHRLKSRERKTEKELKLLEEKGKKEKHVQQKTDSSSQDLKKIGTIKKQQKESKNVEEELSATSTAESSVTCDDKENKRLAGWMVKPKNVSPVSDSSTIQKDATEPKVKHVSFVNSKLKSKGNKNTGCDQEVDRDRDAYFDKNVDALKIPFGHANLIREKRRRENKFKDRKEKSSFRHKSYLDRKPQYYEPVDTSPEKDVVKSSPGFYVSLPTATQNCLSWSENRARFSDVVARNENPNSNDPSPVLTQSSESPQTYPEEEPQINFQASDISSSPLKLSKAICKPTMYVEPYKSTDLGPIGSKRLGTPDSHSPELFGQDRYQPSQFHPMNDTSVIAAVSNNGYLTQGGAYFGHSSTPDVPESEGATALVDWERHQVFRDLTRRNDDSPLFPTADLPDDSWRTLTAHSSTSTVQTGNTDYWSNTFSSVLDSNSKAGNNTSFLWGSNAIWEPWQPPVESPVRRTPPGFDEQIQKRREEEQKRFQHQQLQQNNAQYNPFGTPWSQPWE